MQQSILGHRQVNKVSIAIVKESDLTLMNQVICGQQFLLLELALLFPHIALLGVWPLGRVKGVVNTPRLCTH